MTLFLGRLISVRMRRAILTHFALFQKTKNTPSILIDFLHVIP